MVNLARKNLLHDKLRFLITVAGVAFAVTLVLVQVGLFQGLLDNATVTIQQLDADLWVTSRNTPNVDFAQAFSETAVQRVRSVPGVDYADNLIVAFTNVSLPTGARETAEVYALEDFKRWGFPWNILEGDPDDLRSGHYILLDESARKRFGEFSPGDYREIEGRRFKIIGRTRDALSFTTTPLAFMDYHRAQELYGSLGGQTNYVLVKLAVGADAAAIRAEIQRRLPYNDVYTKQEWIRRSRGYWVVSTGLGLNMGVTVFLGCLVGIVIVAQTLYTSTVENVKQFGTVKAIGGGNGDIYRILGQQAAIAAVCGFALGGMMALGMRPLIGKLDLKILLSAEFAAAVFAGTLVMCLASAVVSFRKVASIDPALVFRT